MSRLCWFRWIVVVNKELGCSLYLSLSFSLCYSLPSLFVSLKEMSVDKMIGIICYGGLERERKRKKSQINTESEREFVKVTPLVSVLFRVTCMYHLSIVFYIFTH